MVPVFRKFRDRWSTLRDQVAASMGTSRVVQIALAYQRVRSEDMTPEAAAELVRVAADGDSIGLAEFAMNPENAPRKGP